MVKTDEEKPFLGSILIIEDDSELSIILCNKFSEEGYTVHAATNVRDATLKLHNQRFDCIILDMVLQRGFGADLIPVLKAHWDCGMVPVIVTSGSLDTALVKTIAPHVKGVFVKPYDFDEVVVRAKSEIKLSG